MDNLENKVKQHKNKTRKKKTLKPEGDFWFENEQCQYKIKALSEAGHESMLEKGNTS